MKNKKLIIYSLISLIIAFLTYNLAKFLTPFLFGFIFAYLLNPLVKLTTKKYKLSRALSVNIVTLFFLIIFIIIIFLLLPLIFKEIIKLLDDLPIYLENINSLIYPKITEFFAQYNIEMEYSLIELIKNNISSNDHDFNGIFQKVISSSVSIFNILALLFLMPFIIYYFLKDWDKIYNKINNSLPEKFSIEFQNIIKLINDAVANYLRGQTNVCLILAIFYCLTLSFFELNYAIIIGIISGILIFIPYLGFFVSFVTSIIIALFQWGFVFDKIGIIILIYLIGQLIESNFLIPYFVGKKINLQPLWLIFGIVFFGALFGIFGIIFAVPLSAISGNLIKYGIDKLSKIK
jgi:predicted PurR-regulated permease PerM